MKRMSEEPGGVAINIYGDFDEFCGKLGELRWLLREGRKDLDLEAINKGLKFRYPNQSICSDNLNLCLH